MFQSNGVTFCLLLTRLIFRLLIIDANRNSHANNNIGLSMRALSNVNLIAAQVDTYINNGDFAFM